jgi:hypothetical protein
MLDSRKNSPFVTPTPSMSVVPAITVMADCLKMGIFNQCLGMLIAAIANPHHVTTRQAIARGQRDSRFDMLVMLSFLRLQLCVGQLLVGSLRTNNGSQMPR